MSTKLNHRALGHARSLIGDGKAVHDSRDDWSEHAPSAQEENDFIERHGWDEYALWHLGVDTDASEHTKQRYSFPYGDFAKVHRCAVISLESRASQNDHDDIRDATKELLEKLDA
jgi:hypothetical protein